MSTLILLASISAATMNIFLPSLPGMAAHFETDYRVMQLSVALYLGVNAVLQIIVGPISDKIGRRPIILFSLFAFMACTLGCIYAPNATIFLAFRMAQAIIVTTMVLSRAIVRDIVSTDQAASMLGYVTMGMSVVPMISPAIGGLLEESGGWQLSFWLLFGLGLIIFVMCWFDLGETKSQSGLTFVQQFSQYPELLKSPRFWGYSTAAACSAGAFFAYLGGAPFVGTEIFGLSAAELGMFFGAPAIGYFAGNFLSGVFSVKFGVNRMVFWGCMINAIGISASLLVFEIGIGTSYSFFGFMTFVGLGNGLCLPNAAAGSLSVRPHLAGAASGLSGAIMLSGGAALSALAGALLRPETGAFPLLWLMLATSVAGVVAIVLTIRRERCLTG